LRKSVPVVARIPTQANLGITRDYPIVRADSIEGPFAFLQPVTGKVVDHQSEGKTATFIIPPFGSQVISMHELPPNVFVTGVRYLNREIIGTGLVLEGQQDASLEIIVGGPESVGYVTGIVRNKFEPATRSKVILIPDTARRANEWLWGKSSTDASGVFFIRNVLPGDYTLLAWEQVERNEWFDPDFLKDQEKFGTKITVRAGIGTIQDLRLIEANQKPSN
jgi:hypothetical protein